MRGCDLFCGAGGSSVGARMAGVEMVAGIDMCGVATATYAANFPDAYVLTSRLEDVNVHSFHEHVGHVDMLLASPECRNHTCAKGSIPIDESSRNTAFQVVKFARTLNSRWLVIENVNGMRKWERYDELKSRLQALGYFLKEKTLDASDYGVPQKRRRLFLVGDRNGPPDLKICKRRGRRKSIRSILDSTGTWNTTPLYKSKRAESTITRAQRAIDSLNEQESFLVVYYGTDGGGGWQPLSRPLRTITTVDRFGLVEYDGEMWRMRMLQIPELLRAMAFGEDFLLPAGTRREKVRLLGNGVCPPVMEIVIRSLLRGK